MSTNIEVFTVMGYAYFAPYLINGDASGMEDDEIAEADEFVNAIKEDFGDSALIVDCKPEEKDFGFPEFGGLAGDVCPYTVHTISE
jgi:hypothetical protein